jgi:hypothetical protein
VTERPGHDKVKSGEHQERLEHDGQWLRAGGEQDHARDRRGLADGDPGDSLEWGDVDVRSTHGSYSGSVSSECQ